MALSNNTFRWVKRLWLNVQGQDLIEYALLAGFVAVVIGATIPTHLVPPMRSIYDSVQQVLAKFGG
jgi:Flp pilus assembly pilin Flp